MLRRTFSLFQKHRNPNNSITKAFLAVFISIYLFKYLLIDDTIKLIASAALLPDYDQICFMQSCIELLA